MVTGQGETGNYDSRGISRQRSGNKLVTEDSIVLFRIETAIIESDTAPTSPTLLNGNTEALDDISATGPSGVSQRQQEAAGWWRRIWKISAAPGVRVDLAVRRYDDMTDMAEIVGKYARAKTR